MSTWVDQVFPLALAAGSSLALLLLARGRGFEAAALREALRRALEFCGLGAALYALNLGLAVAVVLAVRALGGFLSLYLCVEPSLLALSLLQALVLQWWAATSRR